MTPSKLRTHTYKDLAQMAKSQGVSGWHSMRKEELIRALVKEFKKLPQSKKGSGPPRSADAAAKNEMEGGANGSRREAARREVPARNVTQRRISQLQAKLEAFRNLAPADQKSAARVLQDRLVVMVRDPYWLHVYWELTQKSVDRAQSALSQNWHSAQPVLRLFRVADDGSATFLRQIPIHGGVSNWYVDVQQPPCQFRLEIGYVSDGESFYCLARSNTVTTPPAGGTGSIDENWADVAENADRIYAMSGGYSPQGTSLELQELLEERLQRPMGTPMQTRYGDVATKILADPDDLRFAIDAELIIYGASHRDAHVTVKGEPVQLRDDGTFAVRLNFPDRRQVIPVVASSPDGGEQRTIILAVERNTKALEPKHRDPGTIRRGSY